MKNDKNEPFCIRTHECLRRVRLITVKAFKQKYPIVYIFKEYFELYGQECCKTNHKMILDIDLPITLQY